MLAVLRTTVMFLLFSLSAATAWAGKPVVLNGTFGVQTTAASIAIPDQANHSWNQQRREDPIQSDDARFNGATQVIHEQLESLPEGGNFRIYTEIRTATGNLYTFYEGTYKIRQGSVPFTAKGRVVAGSGEFAGVGGHVKVEGDGATGTYSVRLMLSR